ncbi:MULTISPECIES: winged helix-turn-helix domain-containing protein [Haloferax]|uniref:ArsR family transcriptional regulator n=5 Tax=Haloferax TaxID=2251 RepID=A0A558GEQ9_HALVO|nr:MULTISPECIES: winged helix-turn-helix domain-containing protein [Haloferax]MBC9986968.1 ArsR family transcriptional regulator [Haloferax sp. AS1]ELK54593.1 putative transcriptional regulator [Haloferax sp. BAB-2207]ELY33462.1 putative transcriptional regulator [Haloferax volcanii DS2]ELZ55783.1 putative transcriptional regulator [Haloferax sp. ATCC BAA-646]ELZ67302.1 putative transcriptional regulator [Haloferax sp. ATCC BAA-645]
MLWWLIGGSRGGRNRLRIIRALDDMPMNANQLSNELDLDYKTTQHHLELLVENNVLMTMGDNYGKTYFLTDQMEANLDVLDEVARKADLDDVTVGGDDA